MSEPRGEGNEPLVIVARAVKTKGLKGELVAEILTDFPDRFEVLSQLYGVGPGGELKKLTLEKYSLQKDRVVLKFAGYDDIESAKSLVGFEFGISETESIQLPEGEFYHWQLEGCSVEIGGGNYSIGKVQEVLRTGGVELLSVRDEEGNERLIPLAESIVLEINLPEKRIVIDPPEGLLDL